MITVLVYLNDVEEGGGTGFNNLSYYDSPIEIKPKKGRMVVFLNTKEDGSLHPETRHAGLPIIKGDTNDIIEYTNEIEEFKNKKQRKFWIC